MAAPHEEVHVTGPGGVVAGLKGQNAIILVIMAAALAGMIVAQRADRARNIQVFDLAVTRIDDTLKQMRLEHAALLERCAPAR
jgi:hypothetical protein